MNFSILNLFVFGLLAQSSAWASLPARPLVCSQIAPLVPASVVERFGGAVTEIALIGPSRRGRYQLRLLTTPVPFDRVRQLSTPQQILFPIRLQTDSARGIQGQSTDGDQWMDLRSRDGREYQGMITVEEDFGFQVRCFRR